MKISFIRYKNNNQNYKVAKGFGMDVYDIEDPEQIDSQIEKLKAQNYTTIIIPDELASFSENIVSKYKYDNTFNIVITPSKNKSE